MRFARDGSASLAAKRSRLPRAPGYDSAFRRRLLGWYGRYRRDLPWRRTRDPYAVWISELMLQQTQVVTVIPYYQRFLKRFPTVRALAEAPLDDVLRLWAGLGYYARARNLHAAARAVVEQYGGQFPDSVEGLRALPGIGRYTAGAVASIAFNRRAAVVDGNVARVLARLFAVRGPIKSPRTIDRMWRLAESLLPQRDCGDFNQALMELGATVCTPRGPDCRRCPLASLCRAHARGLVEKIPAATAARAPKPVRFVVTALQRGDRWFFEPRPAGGLWGGLWQLPMRQDNDGGNSWRIAAAIASEYTDSKARLDRNPVGEVRWQLTHRTARFIVHHVIVPAAGGRKMNGKGRWLPLQRADDVPLSAAMRRVIELLRGRFANAS